MFGMSIYSKELKLLLTSIIQEALNMTLARKTLAKKYTEVEGARNWIEMRLRPSKMEERARD